MYFFNCAISAVILQLGTTTPPEEGMIRQLDKAAG